MSKVLGHRNSVVSIALIMSAGLAGCASVSTDDSKVEATENSGPQIIVEGAVAECAMDSSEGGMVTLYVRNDGDALFYYNSNEADKSIPKIETILRNENGRGFTDEAWHLTQEEGIAPGETGELYAYFGGLFLGFDGRFNQVDVVIDGELVLEQEISLSSSDCR